jgi:arabinan endo-1,5-alpha-L-arabinosidase
VDWFGSAARDLIRDGPAYGRCACAMMQARNDPFAGLSSPFGLARAIAATLRMTIRLATPSDAPYSYELTLTAGPADEWQLSVSGREANSVSGTGDAQTPVVMREYSFRRNDHASYLDLFAGLARDFGLRRPLARDSHSKAPFAIKFDELLTSNVTPRILYGYGDPAVLRVACEDRFVYYMTCTSNDAPDAFPLLTSTDMHDWQHVGFLFPSGQAPAWTAEGTGRGDFWAPELHQVGNEFRTYFVGRHRRTRELCIGVACAPSPEGRFIATAEPIVRGGAIDPHLFVEDGRSYLYWKEDSNAVWPRLLSNLLHRHARLIRDLFRRDADLRTASFLATLFPWVETLEPMERFLAEQNLIESVTTRFADFERRIATLINRERDPDVSTKLREIREHLKTKMYVGALSADGLSLAGDAVKVLENDQPWEAHVVEGGWIVPHDHRYYLFYAGNDFSTAEYGINVAVSESLWGPFRKSAEPFLRSTSEWSGPGHPSVALAPDGTHVLFLHAFRPGQEGYKRFRAFLSIPFVFENGAPRPRR